MKKKKTSHEEWILGGEVFYRNIFIKITQNSKKNFALESLSNTVKDLQAVRLSTLLKRNPCTGVLEPAVRKSSLISVLE